MKVLIVEDEMLAADRLEMMLRQYDPSIEIMERLEGVEETVLWMKNHPLPDCIFLDIHLSDGSCFNIFQQVQPNVPVIFTTAFDQYALDAFRIMSIDYLLKPVTMEDLSNAIRKLTQLRQPVSPDYSVLQELTAASRPKFKQRFLGKVGQKLFFIETPDITCFVAENKIVYLLSNDGYRYVVEYTLEQLEQMLDPESFFRINRSVIIHVKAIEQVKPYLNSRLKIKMRSSQIDEEELVISRERVAVFKQWADC